MHARLRAETVPDFISDEYAAVWYHPQALGGGVFHLKSS